VKFESEEAQQEFWAFQSALAKFIEESDTQTFMPLLMANDKQSQVSAD
jgi:hypothetical protein